MQKFTGMKRLAWENLSSKLNEYWNNLMPCHYAICIKNEEYEVALEIRKLYEIVPDFDADKTGQIRIIDESGDDYLYPKRFFLPIPLPEAVEELVARAA